MRELAVRLLAGLEGQEVAAGLLERLSSADSTMRSLAAFGLGLTQQATAVAPLVRPLTTRLLRQSNAIWALGRIGDGRAVHPARDALQDASPIVREAAAGALGQLDSTSVVPVLVRLLRADSVASVRRTVAWALGQLEATQAAAALAAALREDRDPTVREMSAWALGNLSARAATPGAAAGGTRRQR